MDVGRDGFPVETEGFDEAVADQHSALGVLFALTWAVLFVELFDALEGRSGAHAQVEFVELAQNALENQLKCAEFTDHGFLVGAFVCLVGFLDALTEELAAALKQVEACRQELDVLQS